MVRENESPLLCFSSNPEMLYSVGAAELRSAGQPKAAVPTSPHDLYLPQPLARDILHAAVFLRGVGGNTN